MTTSTEERKQSYIYLYVIGIYIIIVGFTPFFIEDNAWMVIYRIFTVKACQLFVLCKINVYWYNDTILSLIVIISYILMHAINGYNTLTRIHGICMSNYTIKNQLNQS